MATTFAFDAARYIIYDSSNWVEYPTDNDRNDAFYRALALYKYRPGLNMAAAKKPAPKKKTFKDLL